MISINTIYVELDSLHSSVKKPPISFQLINSVSFVVCASAVWAWNASSAAAARKTVSESRLDYRYKQLKVEWPDKRMTSTGGSPARISLVIAVWRQSCKWKSRTSAALDALAKAVLTDFFTPALLKGSRMFSSGRACSSVNVRRQCLQRYIEALPVLFWKCLSLVVSWFC